MSVIKNPIIPGFYPDPSVCRVGGDFYLSHDGNYIVTAKDPAGPWSRPRWLRDVPGIDASIFFDDDGQCYVMGTGDRADTSGKEMIE